MSGKKILRSLKDAAEGNIARVHEFVVDRRHRFTRGPWRAGAFDRLEDGWKVTAPGPTQDHDGDGASEWIATVYSTNNLELVLAATDLYAALEDIITWDKIVGGDWLPKELGGAVRKALAKARGEPA